MRWNSIATGVATLDVEDEQVPCTIDSVAPLPEEVRAALFGLDEIYSDETRRGEPHTLTESEQRALVFTARLYAENPISQPWEMMSFD